MKTKTRSFLGKLLLLALIVGGLIFLYLTYNTYGNWEFALKIRGKKLAAFLLVAAATGFSTVSFQTLTQNHFLTPNILGLDALYVLVQTVLFFMVGGITMLSQETHGMFFGNIFLMTIISLALSKFFLGKGQNDLFLLLMIGMVSGTLFSSMSTFLQVMMDPNEYDLLQGKLFASFGNVNSNQLLWAAIIIVVVCGLLYSCAPYLDVVHLGNQQAINLGVSVTSLQTLVLLAVSILTGTATALVGPATFLGFIIANISYQLMGTFRHRWLFLASTLIGMLLLVGGQFLVEQVFHLNTTVSTVIQFAGGIYFVGKIIHERKRQV